MKYRLTIGVILLATFISCERVIDPDVSVNSEGIFYSVDGDIFRMNYDGTNSSKIVSNQKDCNNPQIASDGSILVYDLQANLNRIPSGGIMYDFSVINIMDLKRNIVKEISDKNEWCYQASISPDNKLIAFTTQKDDNGSDIAVSDINGKYITQLTNENWNRNPQFTPDGHQILFESYADKSDNLFMIDFDGENLKQLTNSERNVNSIFTPDGNKIVWESYRDIYIMNLDGSNKINLTEGKYYESVPSFSNHGDKIVFIAEPQTSIGTKERTFEIHILDIETNERSEIVKTGKNYSPMFFPNDNKILFSRYENNQFYIYSINIDGSDLKQLARGGNAVIH